MPTSPPHPVDPPDPDELPHALTFFLSRRERRDVLDALRRRHRDRARALLIALGLAPSRTHSHPKGTRP